MDSSVSSSSPAEAGLDDYLELVGLGRDSAYFFQSGRYAECIDVLNQLLKKKRSDVKVLQNLAVAEYCREGFSEPKKLLDVLNNLKEKTEELARASREQIEIAGIEAGSVISAAERNSTNEHQVSTATSGSIPHAHEFGNSTLVFNIAVILYHLREYAQALAVLEQLYQNMNSIDETTALYICLLMLDVAFACYDAPKAAASLKDLVHYLDICSSVGCMLSQGDNGSVVQDSSLNPGTKASYNGCVVQDTSSNPGTKTSFNGSIAQDSSSNPEPEASSLTANIPVSDASNPDSSASANASDNILGGTLTDDALQFENYLSTDSGRAASNVNSKISTDRSASATDLKLKLQLYKVRLLLLTRNYKAAKREIKLAMNIARGRDSSTALLWKSHLEYARGNHRKAVKLLMTSTNRTEAATSSLFNNNLGCIYHHLQKHHTSMIFFSKALKSSLSLRSEKPLKLSTQARDKSLAITYNCGLQYLACGKPLVAARCFQKSSAIFYGRPLLWLRLAECCLCAFDKGLLTSANASSGDDDVKLHVVGSGQWRQLVVENRDPRKGSWDSGENGALCSDDQCSLSLPFARQCLLNALHLLSKSEVELSKSATSFARLKDESDKEKPVGIRISSQKNISSGDSKASHRTLVSHAANANGDYKGTEGGVSLSTSFRNSLSDHEDLWRKENQMIKQAVLGDLAYIELSLENHLKALSAARELQQLPGCSRMYIFLGRVYAAEALCCLNRPKEAAEQLMEYVSGENNVMLPYSDEDSESWRSQKGLDGVESTVSTNAKTSVEDAQGNAFLKPEEARGALYVNLATISVMQGDLEQGSKLVRKALSALPNHPKAVLAAVFVDLLQGRTQAALCRMRECRHARFISSDVT